MLGNVVLGLGVALEVFAGAAALPGEGLVLAVSTVLHKPFSSVKIANDVILVLLALLLSFPAAAEIGEFKSGSMSRNRQLQGLADSKYRFEFR